MLLTSKKQTFFSSALLTISTFLLVLCSEVHANADLPVVVSSSVAADFAASPICDRIFAGLGSVRFKANANAAHLGILVESNIAALIAAFEREFKLSLRQVSTFRQRVSLLTKQESRLNNRF